MIRKLILLGFFAALSVEAFAQGRTRTTQSTKKISYSLTGVVVLDDGTPAVEPVEVMLICSGAVRQRVHTQTSGQFFFNLEGGGQPDVDSPETAASPIGGGMRSFNQIGRGFGDDGQWESGRASGNRLHLADCELIASLPGFVSDVKYPGTLDAMGNPDVGSIRLHRRTQVQGTTISIKSLSAPPKALTAYGKAREELGKKKVNHQKALKELEKAVELYPEFAAAWHHLAKSYLVFGETGKAMAAYQKAAAADPDFLLPVLGLAELYLQNDRPAESAELSARVVHNNPNVMLGWYLQGYATLSLGKVELAEKCVRKVLASPEAARYPGSHYLMGSIYASRGDLSSASAEYLRFLEVSPGYPGAESLRKQIKTWSAGKTEQARNPQ